jgi:hypothetical protein
MAKIRGKPPIVTPDLSNLAVGDIVTLASGICYRVTDTCYMSNHFGPCIAARSVDFHRDITERLFKISDGEHVYREQGRIVAVTRGQA